MIHSVSVRAGTGALLRAAQDHAIRIAEWQKARIRALAIWSPKDAVHFDQYGYTMEVHAREKLELVEEKCRKAGVPISRTMSGQGIVEGLLDEAARTDIIVLGLPLCGNSATGDLFRPVLAPDDLSLLHELPCSVLIVHGPPQLVGEICVMYSGGRAGKDALNMAAELAGPAVAKVLVGAVARDVADATVLAAEATEYLKSFDLIGHRSESIECNPSSAVGFLDFATSNQVDMIVIGDEPSGFIDKYFGHAVAKDIATTIAIPTLIAR